MAPWRARSAERAEAAAWSCWSSLTPGNAWQRPFARLAPRFFLAAFVIVVISLHRDYLPSAWALYKPTWVDLTLFFGTICFFGTLFLLFLKFLPAVAVQEMKELRHELHEQHAHHEIPEFSQEMTGITQTEAGRTRT